MYILSNQSAGPNCLDSVDLYMKCLSVSRPVQMQTQFTVTMFLGLVGHKERNPLKQEYSYGQFV